MKKNIMFLIILTTFTQTIAQISDNFADGNFTDNPTWYGDSSLFCINANHQLQLNAPSAGSAFLFLPTPYYSNNREWRFYIGLNFSPSTNNYARFYLKDCHQDFYTPFIPEEDTASGFYLQFGENLSNDAIELFYKNRDGPVSICRGTTGLIAASFALNIKLLYNPIGLWEIWVDELLNGNYRLEASGMCQEPFSANSLGFFCKYTSSNITKFTFDDLYCGPPIIDTLPPEIVKVSGSENGKSVSVIFSESVTPESALNRYNYLIDNTIYPDSTNFSDNTYSEVILNFSTALADRETHTLQISGISDMSENHLTEILTLFTCISIRRNDILITEIMADPTPMVNLPECEYLELFNHGIEDTVILKGWILQLGNSYKNLPEITIPPQGYALLLGNSYADYYTHLSNRYTVSSLGISNEGQTIALYNAQNEVMHCVPFLKSWHINTIKQDGGWSLEMIDPDNPCGDKENWDSSIAEDGGTPSAKNSIFASNVNIHSPDIKKITVTDSLTVKIFFSETMITPLEIGHFQIDHNIIIESVSEVPPTSSCFILHLKNCLQQKIIYTLSVTDSLSDCTGNYAPFASFSFAIPEKADSFDLVINELLFNPFGDSNADFIEIYNRSNKVIDLSEIMIGVGGTNFPDKAITADGSGYQLFPSDYVVISKKAEETLQDYYVPHPQKIIACDSLPAFSNSGGTLHLTDRSFRTIDRLTYDEKMHYSLLSTTDGVSLERIHFHRETQNDENWKSASESAGFATPTYQNSQFSELGEITEKIAIVPEIFSPNNDGIDDYTEIYCNFSESENRVSITIYDKSGYIISQLVNNQICQKDEIFRWEGISNRNFLVSEGLYLIEIEYWNTNGKRRSIRKSVGVVR